MALGNIHASKLSVFWGWLILSILLSVIPQKHTGFINLGFKKLFGFALNIGGTVNPNTFSQSDQAVSQSEYNSLWKSHKNLQARLAELEKENKILSRMRRQFGFSDAGLLAAKIITSIRSTRQELIINQGSEQGVSVGQLVLSPSKDSIIGIIRETDKNVARVGLLTDSSVSIEVRIRRDNSTADIAAQLFGDGKNGCQIRLIPRDKDIRKGDTVYAAAHPGKLDVPIVIGQVQDVRIDQDRPLLWSISVKPVESITELNQVVIIVPLTK